MRNVSRLALACAVCSLAVASANGRAAAPAQLAGAWEMNRDLGTAPGSEPGGVDGAGMDRPGARGGRGAGRGPGGGGGGRGPGGGGGGGIGRGGGGGRSGGGPSGGAPSSEDMEARRALMQEVMTLPARMTIAQDGDKVVVIEPDGVVRTYVAAGAAEKHQLTNGTIETRSKWEGPVLRMDITLDDRLALVRTFEVRDDPRRLEVATGREGGPKDARQVVVYDEVPR